MLIGCVGNIDLSDDSKYLRKMALSITWTGMDMTHNFYMH